MLAITFYSVVLSVHIMAVVVAFGFSFAYPVVLTWARRSVPASMPLIHQVSGRVNRLVMSPALVVVLLAGVYLASDADAWSEVWVTVPLVLLLIIGGLGGIFCAPTARRLAELPRRDLGAGGGELSAEYGDLFRRVAAAGYAV